MSRINRAERRKVERRMKKRTLRLQTELDTNVELGSGWAAKRRGHSIQWRKADTTADLTFE